MFVTKSLKVDLLWFASPLSCLHWKPVRRKNKVHHDIIITMCGPSSREKKKLTESENLIIGEMCEVKKMNRAQLNSRKCLDKRML